MIKPYDEWTAMTYDEWLAFIEATSDTKFLSYDVNERLELTSHLDRFICGHCDIEWVSRKESSRAITERRRHLAKQLHKFIKLHQDYYHGDHKL